MEIKIPLGVENFGELRENGFYYVDKTTFIPELLQQEFKANLVTRPRRFGKSLMMSMLEDFFDISRDSRTHFEGLAVSKETALCKKWMNQWPVALLSLKSVEGLNFSDAYGRLEVLIANVCKKYAFLADSSVVGTEDLTLFRELMAQRASKQNVSDCLLLLTRMLSEHYGKPVILLIDEYDVPLDKAYKNGYYREMLDLIRSILGAALKTNPYLQFGVITGCLKISRESVFTGINNLVTNTIMVERFDKSIGFTGPEVEALLLEAGFPDHVDEMRTWYDGYRFGRARVYCPWDVLNHVAALMEAPNAKPRSYWADSSGNDVIYRLFEHAEFDVNGKFETLMEGGSIRENVTENLTYDSLEASEENLWSLLLMTGYLTLAEDKDGEPSRDEKVALRIPNEEIRWIFGKAIIEWFRKNVRTIDRTELFQALWNGEAGKASEGISDLLFDSISYYDYRESYYHAFVAGLFVGAGYAVESNYEYGDGRPDIVVKERRRRRAMLFEVKHAGKNETLEQACRKAVDQVKEKRYAEALSGYRTVLAYGIAFKGKECIIRMVGDVENL